MSIRTWEEKDLSPITMLLNRLKKDLHEEADIDSERVRLQFEEMIKYPETYECFVYELDGTVVGFISLVFYRTAFHRTGTALVNELVVAEEYRNRKFGKELLDRAIREAMDRDMDEMEVGVMKDNGNAMRFYRRNGMTEEYLLLGMEFDGSSTETD